VAVTSWRKVEGEVSFFLFEELADEKRKRKLGTEEAHLRFDSGVWLRKLEV